MPLKAFAFTLKAEHRRRITGASITLRGGEHFDVVAALKKGRGTIKTDDAALASQLRRLPILAEAQPDAPTRTSRRRRAPRRPAATTPASHDTAPPPPESTTARLPAGDTNPPKEA